MSVIEIRGESVKEQMEGGDKEEIRAGKT